MHTDRFYRNGNVCSWVPHLLALKSGLWLSASVGIARCSVSTPVGLRRRQAKGSPYMPIYIYVCVYTCINMY